MSWIDTTATTTVEPSVSYDILVVKGLAMKYQPGGEISLHRNSTGYGRIAYSISSCEFIFQLEDIKYRIPANNVISFPAKVPHAAYHIGDHERLVLCCWEFTPKRTAN